MRKFLLAMLLLPTISYSEQIDKMIATVNETPITQSDYDNMLAMAVKELQAMKVPLPTDEQLKKQINKKLIQENLITQLARNNNIEISDEELNSAINNLVSRNKMDIFQFKQALKNEGMNFEDYRENFRKQILIQNIKASIANRETVISEKEIRSYLDNMDILPQNKEYHLASILIKSPSSQSKEDIKQFQQKSEDIMRKVSAGENFSQLAASNSDAPNALNGGDLGWASLNDFPPELAEKIAKLNIGDFIGPLNTPNGVLILKVLGTKAKQVASNKETEYKVQHILLKTTDKTTDQELEGRLKAIKNEILKNNNFKALAKINSDDLASGNNGGELGWITDKDVVPEFADAMQHNDTGVISDPFKSQFGWHILLVEDKRSVDQSKKMLREQAIASLKQQKSKDTIQKWMDELEDSAYVNYVG